MDKGKIFILVLAVVCITAAAQNRYGIKAGVGASGAKYKSGDSKENSSISYMPSAQLGFFYQNTFKNKFVIGAELNFNQYNFKQNTFSDNAGRYIIMDPGPTPNSVKSEMKYFSSGIQPAFNFGYTAGKFTGTAGLGINYNLYNHVKGQSSVTYSGEYANVIRYDYGYFQRGLPSASNFTFGIRLGGGYMINNKMSLGVSYSKYSGYKSNQFLAEMRYYFR